MKLTLEPNGYKLEIAESVFDQLHTFHHRVFFYFSTQDDVNLKLTKQDLADINKYVMALIAGDSFNDEAEERKFIQLHFMIDEYVVADQLHSGYPNTWPWAEN